MEKEKFLEIGKLLFGITIVSLSLLISRSIDLSFGSLVSFQMLVEISPWIGLAAVAFLTPLGMYILLSIKDKRLFLIGWLISVLGGVLVLKVNQLDDLTVLSFIVAGVFAHGDEIRKVSHVWGRIRKLRTLATIVFLLISLAVILPNAQFFNSLFLREALTWANSIVPSENLTTLAERFIPTDVTPQEIQILEERLSSMPEWNLLTPQERNILLSQAVEQLKTFKEALKASIQESLKEAKITITEEMLEEFIRSDPLLSTLVDHLYLFLLLIVLAIFSLFTEVGSLLAFLLLLPLEWWRIRNLPKEEGC